MIFVTTYKNEIEAVFFHIWDAQQHINHFDMEEQEQMEILRVEDRVVKLQNLKENLKEHIIDTTNHCCGNCGRTFWDKGLFICDFNKEEVNPNDHCTHYI